MNTGGGPPKAVAVAVLVLAAYLGLLLLAEPDRGIAALALPLVRALPVLVLFSLASYSIRYARWRWLLGRAGAAVPAGKGALIYLAGFAFTATPGKVGELVRARYLAMDGIAPRTAIAVFLYERLFDLVAVLLLSTVAMASLGGGLPAVLFVSVIAGGVIGCALFPQVASWFAQWPRRAGWQRIGGWAETLAQGLADVRIWAKPADAAISLLAGLAAWGLTGTAFAWLLANQGHHLGMALAVSIYPLAMLAGASSMLPGGLGTTELAIVVLLGGAGIAAGSAAFHAVAIRLGTLWFAIVLGAACMLTLERRYAKAR